MPNEATLTVHGFWSYAREQRSLQASFHAAVENGLREVFGRNPKVAIAIDGGIPGGHDWRRWIVRSISRSAVFYCLQSPSSFASEACRFELQVFEAQVERIARQFSHPGRRIDPEQLRELWFTPILWEAIHDRQWPTLLDSPEAERIGALWRRSQVPEDFNVAGLSVQEFTWRGKTLARHVRDLVFQWEDLSGSPLQALLEFLAEDDPAFVSSWVARYPERGRVPVTAAATAQQRLAHDRTRGLVRSTDAALGLDFFLVPAGEGGFWASAVPLGDRLALDLHAKLGAGRRGASGHWVWPAAAAETIGTAFADYGLYLPDDAGAQVLQGLARAGSGACHQLGWRSPLHRFWWQGAAGLQPEGGELPILLVKTLG